MRLRILLFALFLLGMTACSGTAPEAAATVPPEPTNTPLPAATVAPSANANPCSVEAQVALIEAAFAEYGADGSAETDPLSALHEWTGGVSAEIATRCQPSASETTPPDQLATLLEQLHQGGYIIYVRHTHTDRSRQDSDVSFGNCEAQRVLSEQGRDEARMMRHYYDRLDLPISTLVSTQYCRTVETAVLAFGVPRLVLRSTLFEQFTEVLSAEPPAGTNTIIVAHIGTIRNNIGLDATFEEGDSLVYRPLGAGEFEFIGRIALYDWPVLAELNAAR